MFPQTKFHRPPVRAEHVERSQLLEAIRRSAARIVVVSAPAGFGKSTLLAQWAERAPGGDRLAWVSIDSDDEGRRLWLAILTALRPIVGDALTAPIDAAEAHDADLRAGVLIALLDALAETSAPVTLVLDDLHLVLADDATRASLDWFLERLPRQHGVVIASRRDPGLKALARMRIQGEAFDVRADDLRFGAEETARFLRHALALDVDARQLADLERRTEGWPAALYLAAVRLRLGDEPDAVIEQLEASDEDLIGDLVDEMLRSSPEHERRFIRETSVLDRFNVDLCARVLGDGAAAREAFTTLTRSSLLVSPLDRGRTWFRCHHLLRDVLHNRLLAEDPAYARELHVRAGGWFETEGGESELYEAMHHYLTARDWELAAELLTCHSIRFVQSGTLGGSAREWLAQFPAEVVGGDARLCYVNAVLAALDGDRDRRDAWLASGEHAGWVGPMPDGTASYALAAGCLTAMLCFDDLGAAVGAAREALAQLPRGAPVRAAVESLTAWHLHLLGAHEEAERIATQALVAQVHLPSSGLPLVAYLPRAVLGLAALGRGELAPARTLLDEAAAERDRGPLRASPHSLPVAYARARLLTLEGRPDSATDACRAGLELARGWRDSSLMVPALLLELARAQSAAGDHEAARRAADRARDRIATARDAGGLAAALEGVVPAADPALQDLSDREIEVLRALSGDGSLRQVADELFISRNTIKSHTRALYAKLGVASRADALHRGRQLGLVPGAERRPLSTTENRR